MGTSQIPADRQTDGRTEMTKIMGAVRDPAAASKNSILDYNVQCRGLNC